VGADPAVTGNDLDCTIYVDAPSGEEIVELLVELTGGRADRFGTVEAPGVALDVDGNDEADAGRRSEFPDGFLFFSNRVELYSETPPAVALVTELLEALWARGWPAVAACDYEDELPHGGGYKSASVPWPRR
jgi:hypothetical protein